MFVVDFFEECIKEEQYEAQKLDILRDAVRAKTQYTTQSKTLVTEKSISIKEEEGGDQGSELDSSLSSPRVISPTPPPSDAILENGRENGIHNGEDNMSNGTNGTVANDQ